MGFKAFVYFNLFGLNLQKRVGDNTHIGEGWEGVRTRMDYLNYGTCVCQTCISRTMGLWEYILLPLYIDL